jgi:hypothetical protein
LRRHYFSRFRRHTGPIYLPNPLKINAKQTMNHLTKD